MVLLCLRTTPIDHTIPSPGEMLFNRKMVSNIPVKCTNHSAKKAEISARLYKRQAEQKAYYDQHAKDLPDIQIGQHVRMYDKDTNRWSPAVVTQTCTEPRSYIIKTPSGQVLRRNRKHLRGDPSTANRDPPEIILSRVETNPQKNIQTKTLNTPSQTSNHHLPQES